MKQGWFAVIMPDIGEALPACTLGGRKPVTPVGGLDWGIRRNVAAEGYVRGAGAHSPALYRAD